MYGNAHYTVAESPLQALKKLLFCGNIRVQKEAENKYLLPFFVSVFYSFAFNASNILMRGILRDTARLISQGRNSVPAALNIQDIPLMNMGTSMDFGSEPLLRFSSVGFLLWTASR